MRKRAELIYWLKRKSEIYVCARHPVCVLLAHQYFARQVSVWLSLRWKFNLCYCVYWIDCRVRLLTFRFHKFANAVLKIKGNWTIFCNVVAFFSSIWCNFILCMWYVVCGMYHIIYIIYYGCVCMRFIFYIFEMYIL